jgi:dipeptidase
MEICEIFKDIKKTIIVKLMTDIPNNTKGICVYATDSFLTYLFMPVVVVLVYVVYNTVIFDDAIYKMVSKQL